jgi:hypothetical protein
MVGQPEHIWKAFIRYLEENLPMSDWTEADLMHWDEKIISCGRRFRARLASY